MNAIILEQRQCYPRRYSAASQTRLGVLVRRTTWAMGMAMAFAHSPSSAGVLSRNMLEQRALESVEAVYADGSEAEGHNVGGSCRAKDSGFDVLTYFLRCQGKGDGEFWMARSSNGEIVEVSPLDDAAVAKLKSLAPGSRPFDDPDYVRAVHVSASERSQLLRAARQARY